MRAKRMFFIFASFIMVLVGATVPAQAGKPGEFSGKCINTFNGNGYTHTLTFANVPGGTLNITIQGFGYYSSPYVDYGFGSTNLIVNVKKPFTYTVSDNDDVYRYFYFDGGNSYTQGYVTYTQFTAQPTAHNGSIKAPMITVVC